jgi:2-haloalkanoic acid dehalogenase type II
VPDRYDIVLFDLLSALLDSWSLWDDVAGDPEAGRRWRMRYLQATNEAAGFEPYLPLIARAAAAVGLPGSLAGVLEKRWSELNPWLETTEVLAELAKHHRLGVVTNCSEALGRAAVRRIPIEFGLVLTAEQADCFKPDPRIYAQAIEALDAKPERVLYVAGSPYDVLGAAKSGMPVYWHNRLGLSDPSISSRASFESASLQDLVACTS